jgi:hypothetical protein
MPKENIDYSNTIIYKIYCNDKTINDIYIGHTTNFTKRKYQHKLCCSNLNNKFKIYNTIRQHGGWDNWNMLEIAKYNCKDKTEARIKEQHHYDELNSSLNSCPPYVDKNKYFCSTCNINCNTKNVYETHINCSLHNKILHKNGVSIPFKFYCSICFVKCFRKSEWLRHIQTDKHKNNENCEISNGLATNFSSNVCTCGKHYKDRSGLWRHKKKCIFINNNQNTEIINKEETEIISEITPELILNIIQQNQEFKNLLIEQNKQNQEFQKQMLEVCKNSQDNYN